MATSGQPRTGRLVLVGVLIAGAIGAGAMLGWHGIDKKAADGNVPVIKAAQNPVKVEPEVSDADKVRQDEEAAAAKDSAAKVINKEEQPVEVVTPPGSPPIKIARIIPLSGSQARSPDPANPDTVPAGAPIPANGFPQPRVVKTVSVRPDGTVIGGDKATQSAARPPANVQVADATPAPEPDMTKVPVPQSRPNLPQATAAAPSRTPTAASSPDLIAKTIKTTTPKATTRAMPAASAPQDPNAPLQLTPVEPATPVAAAPVKVAAAEPAQPAAAAAGGSDGFAVQLGVAGSDVEAQGLSAKLESQYGSVLGSYRPSVRKSDVNGKTIYRVRIVNLAKNEAVSICEKLHGAGGQCFVAH